MKKIVFLLSAIVIVVASCNAPDNSNKATNKTANTELTKTELLTKIQQGEKKLFGDTLIHVNRKSALNIVDEYMQFAGRFPDDTMAAEYLFKASDISMNLNRPQQTVEIFNKLIETYPDFNKIPTCYFLRAFVYDDQLKDYKTAEKYYREFIKKYPNSDFADDAEMLLKNLGKTPEELIKEFGQEK